jgi:hypothetical protein
MSLLERTIITYLFTKKRRYHPTTPSPPPLPPPPLYIPIYVILRHHISGGLDEFQTVMGVFTSFGIAKDHTETDIKYNPQLKTEGGQEDEILGPYNPDQLCEVVSSYSDRTYRVSDKPKTDQKSDKPDSHYSWKTNQLSDKPDSPYSDKNSAELRRGML